MNPTTLNPAALDEARDLLAHIVASAREEIAALEAALADRAESDKHSTAVVGQGYLVVDTSYALGLKIDNRALAPVRLRPDGCGVSRFTRDDAVKVAKLRGDGWVVVYYRDVAQLRIDYLREMFSTAALS